MNDANDGLSLVKRRGGFNELSQFLIAYRQALGLFDSDVQRLKSGETDIEFTDYDWRLNRTP